MIRYAIIGLLLLSSVSASAAEEIPAGVQALSDYVLGQRIIAMPKVSYYFMYSTTFPDEKIDRQRLIEQHDETLTLEQMNAVDVVTYLKHRPLSRAKSKAEDFRLACIFYNDKNTPLLDLYITRKGLLVIEGQSYQMNGGLLKVLIEHLPNEVREDILRYYVPVSVKSDGPSEEKEVIEVTLQPQMPRRDKKLWRFSPQVLTPQSANGGLEACLKFNSMVGKDILVRFERQPGQPYYNWLFIDTNLNQQFEETEKVVAGSKALLEKGFSSFETVILIERPNPEGGMVNKTLYPVSITYVAAKEDGSPEYIRYYCNGWMQGQFNVNGQELCVMLIDMNSDGLYDSKDSWAMAPFRDGRETQYLLTSDTTGKISESCRLDGFEYEIECVHPYGRRLSVRLTGRVDAKENQPSASEPEQTAAKRPQGLNKRIKFHRDFKTALRQARQEDKPLFIDFETDWCGYCKKMDQEVYPVEAVVEAADSVVAVKVDGDREKKLTKKFKVSAYPTMVLASPGGNVIKKEVGYRTAEQMVEFLNVGTQADQRNEPVLGEPVEGDGNALDMEAFCGVWMHNRAYPNQTEHQHVMECAKDPLGRLQFSFIQQRYSYQPVFAGCKVHGDRLEIKFNMVGYTDNGNSDYRLAYVLKAEEGALVGTLYESWSEPVDVILTKMN